MFFQRSSRRLFSKRMWIHVPTRWHALLLLPPLCCGLAVLGQETSNSAAQQEQERPAIRSQTNLIVVRVVVRDAKGNPVTGLSQADFQLFDNRKPQVISSFSSDMPDAMTEAEVSGGGTKQPGPATATPFGPQKFTALFFDDYHLGIADLIPVRDAAKRYLAKKLGSGERVAIFTSSGHVHVEFTTDREKLEDALSHLVLAPRFESTASCAKLPVYLAKRVEDLDSDALTAAEDLVRPCYCKIEPCPVLAEATRDESRNVIRYSDEGAAATIAALEQAVRRIAETPGGERTIAMVSDGFLNEEYRYQLDTLITKALVAKVVINVLDAKGLYVELPGESEYVRQGRQRTGDVLLEAAEGTGGILVQNSNDMESGLSRIGGLRSASYLLGFAPTDLKFDGQFHKVTVKLGNKENLTVQTRQGYFAPKQAENAEAAENDKLERAMFSQRDTNELPVQFSTKFDKVDAQTTKFSVIAEVDLRSMRFRKAGGNNLDDVTMMLGIFDVDGNYITGQKKTLKMHLSDTTLRKLESSGATMTTEVNVKPGNYVVRAVVLESESQQMSAGSQSVAIP
jgi:VWFA-related protein